MARKTRRARRALELGNGGAQRRAGSRTARFPGLELLAPRRGDARVRASRAAVHVPHHVEGRDALKRARVAILRIAARRRFRRF